MHDTHSFDDDKKDTYEKGYFLDVFEECDNDIKCVLICIINRTTRKIVKSSVF